MRVLAEYLKERDPGQSVLVISNPFAEMPGRAPEIYDVQNASLAGLRKGFGDIVELKIGIPKLKPAAIDNPAAIPMDPKTKTPLSFLVEEGAFDQLVEQHPACKLVVSLIGVPANREKFTSWTNPGAPAFALLLPDWRMIGDAQAILTAFQSGKLAAAVVENRGAPEIGKGGEDYRMQFQSRFLLLTPENVGDLLEKHPDLFAL